jgi:hypothetical protein
MSLSEAEAIGSELSPPFTVALPEQLKVPLVFNSPHSGRIYPSTFLAASRLDSRALRRSEDAYVEELFAFVTGLGAPLLHAHFPRAYLDVNREPYELDPIHFGHAEISDHQIDRSCRELLQGAQPIDGCHNSVIVLAQNKSQQPLAGRVIVNNKNRCHEAPQFLSDHKCFTSAQ